jgi:hypothetical protein
MTFCLLKLFACIVRHNALVLQEALRGPAPKHLPSLAQRRGGVNAARQRSRVFDFVDRPMLQFLKDS